MCCDPTTRVGDDDCCATVVMTPMGPDYIEGPATTTEGDRVKESAVHLRAALDLADSQVDGDDDSEFAAAVVSVGLAHAAFMQAAGDYLKDWLEERLPPDKEASQW